MSAGPETVVPPNRVRSGTWQAYQPWWWRLSAWTALTVYTAVVPHELWRQIAGGVLVAVSAIALQVTDQPRWRRTAVFVSTIAGLAGMLVSPGGLAEVGVALVAGKLPIAFERDTVRVLVVIDTIVFGATVGWISHSVSGLLAGLAIPAVVQRAAEHREMVEQRDRAQALLAEVQAGREAESQAAALRERGRIARDMHDVLAHSLAGLSLQLQAVRAVAAREGVGATVLEPLDKAADLARGGLAEARQVVGTLRDPAGLGLDALPALVQRHPGDAAIISTGAPAEVAPDTGHAIYRVVQESLTNAARYAPGSGVRVQLAWTADELSVRIDDDGLPPGRTAVADQGTGLGIAGMDERVRPTGGSLRAGPRPEGGWRVEVTVPVDRS